jgi:hypothetical protein
MDMKANPSRAVNCDGRRTHTVDSGGSDFHQRGLRRRRSRIDGHGGAPWMVWQPGLLPTAQRRCAARNPAMAVNNSVRWAGSLK